MRTDPHAEGKARFAAISGSRRPAATDQVPATAEGARRLLEAAKASGLALAKVMASDAAALSDRAHEISGLGDAVQAGIREEARRLAELTAGSVARIEALLSRA